MLLFTNTFIGILTFVMCDSSAFYFNFAASGLFGMFYFPDCCGL